MKMTERLAHILACILIFGIMGLCGCQDKSENNSQPAEQTQPSQEDQSENTANTTNTEDGLISAMDAWNVLQDDIYNWAPDTKIAQIRAGGTTQWDKDGREKGWSFYVEGTVDGKTRSTSFSYIVGDYAGGQQGKFKDEDTAFSTGYVTFSPSDWKVDSTEAAQAAMADALQQNAAFNGGVKAQLVASQGIPVWEVDLSNKKANTSPFMYGGVKINGRTGEIMERQTLKNQ